MHANYLERRFFGELMMLEEKYLSNVRRILFMQITWNVIFGGSKIRYKIKNVFVTFEQLLKYFKFRNKPEIVSKKVEIQKGEEITYLIDKDKHHFTGKAYFTLKTRKHVIVYTSLCLDRYLFL